MASMLTLLSIWKYISHIPESTSLTNDIYMYSKTWYNSGLKKKPKTSCSAAIYVPDTPLLSVCARQASPPNLMPGHIHSFLFLCYHVYVFTCHHMSSHVVTCHQVITWRINKYQCKIILNHICKILHHFPTIPIKFSTTHFQTKRHKRKLTHFANAIKIKPNILHKVSHCNMHPVGTYTPDPMSRNS